MEFRILGPLEVVDDGRLVPLERRLSRALLAYLLLHANEPVSSDRLVDQLWGETAPKTALASLQNTVSRLRKTIGPERIRHDPAGYTLRIDPETFDLARFERLVGEAKSAPAATRAELLRAALALWRGSPLEDMSFEPFADAEAAALSERRLEAVEERIAAELELGAGSELVAELEELVLANPLRERFRAQLMLALYRAGRQADALEAYAAARRTMRDELGLDPGDELRTLQRRILDQDASLRRSVTGAPRGESRRTVSVLFCDVVGSTRLATRLDAEAYRALMSTYYDTVRAAIEAHDGRVEKFIGDAVMALFGVPELHEDDALRAVRAAVDARDAVARLTETAAREWDAELAVRVAVNTGEVITGTGDAAATGAAVNVAAHLEKRAGSNQIVLGTATYELVRDAVEAEVIELSDGSSAWRLGALVPAETPVARRLDAPLVGRKTELRRLRAAFQRARKEDACVVATVVGEAGIGKTRLARELVDSLRDDAEIVVGRCVSYGAGATYLPIAEIVRGLAPGASVAAIASVLEGEDDAERIAERVAEVVGLADGPSAPGEAFWAVRRFFEALASQRPLIVALDDIHWAEPTLLDLVEYLGEWADAPILLLCLARRELLESRPGWGGPTSTGFVLELEPLAAEDVGSLVETLADGPVASDIHSKIVEHAGGNPLFAEQLLALASEAPDVALDHAPPTVEALIGSRLDRLASDELDVLQRAAVVGRRFGATGFDRVALDGLERRGLVHETDAGYRFHHVLVRDVAYRGIPKATRADLHERVARSGGPDEVVGFHYERAYRYRVELARADDRARAIAQLAGEHLGAAAIRAWKRADAPAARSLFRRAVDLLPTSDARRREYLCELGLVARFQTDVDEAEEALRDAAALAADARDRRVELRARVELAFCRLYRAPDEFPRLLDFVSDAIAELESYRDDRALGRAWLLAGVIRGQFQCLNDAWADAARRAATHYRAAGFSATRCIGDLALALYFGSEPVPRALSRCDDLLRENEGDPAICAAVLEVVGLLRAHVGDFSDAEAAVNASASLWRDLGQKNAAESTVAWRGLIEMLRGDWEAAEAAMTEACEGLARRGEYAVLASRAAQLADVQYMQEKYDEAGTWAATSLGHAAKLDLHAQALGRSISAKVAARAGDFDRAETLAREAIALLEPTDALNDRGDVLLASAEVLRLSGKDAAAADAAERAHALFVEKGSIVLAARSKAVARSASAV
jgi:DNA-binding SARP family transcriptional activator